MLLQVPLYNGTLGRSRFTGWGEEEVHPGVMETPDFFEMLSLCLTIAQFLDNVTPIPCSKYLGLCITWTLF